jgi:hypothetical protein
MPNQYMETGQNFNRGDRYNESIQYGSQAQIAQHATLPQHLPEQDPFYESSMLHKRGSFAPQNRLDPLPVRHTHFLKRGMGNGGSPTNFDVKKTVIEETGGVTLAPIHRRHQSVTLRVRGKDGGYAYTKGSMANMAMHGRSQSNEMSPERKLEL